MISTYYTYFQGWWARLLCDPLPSGPGECLLDCLWFCVWWVWSLMMIMFYPQSLVARDSMAKAFYGALFDWIVDKVCVHVLAVV